MRVLVVGSGGREHCLVWKIAQSPMVEIVYCAPGNGGIAANYHCVQIEAEDIEKLADFAEKERIDLTVVGPEAPLVKGIVNVFQQRGLLIFGPNKEASILEGSKAFTKQLLKKYGIPSPDFSIFDDPQEAKDHILSKKAPLVVKADGLAAGKGVMICKTEQQALDAIELIMEKKIFKEAGNKVVIEEFLEGEEASIMAITDGKIVVPLATSQDHKQVYDNDQGPNTGGMGAYSPALVVNEELFQKIMDTIMVPVVKALNKEGYDYRGVLYAGLMIKNNEAKVLEFNCRFGDPETQPVLARMKSDLVPFLVGSAKGDLNLKEIEFSDQASVCVVIASGGYPGNYEKNKLIFGLERLKHLSDIIVFHAGTKLEGGNFITSGGRVLGITALGKDIREAKERAYKGVSLVHFDKMHYRKDIADKAFKYL